MSTYSPDLRIELITTGDQAGTWGNTTNTNLSNVIEQAIAGYVSVSVTSANQALTYLNGGSTTAALNQSVFAAIALTTTTGANFNVYAPPSSKQYTIYNASAYTATIYNSTVIGNTTAAGTGAIIPAGKTVTVWSDGTNFSFQNNHLSSLTLATALPATSGGTGVSSFTASGVVYAATSSTLATGAALTFDGTNLGIGTSSPAYKLDVRGGVIAAGNGTITGGISYSTRVEMGAISNHNLGFITNNTTAMLLDTSGNLGIGTSSPATKLDVVEASNTFAAKFKGNGGTNFVAIGTTSFGASINGYTAGFAAAADLVLQPNGGNLGLGVTPSAWGATYRAMDIRTGALYDPATGTAFGITFNAYNNGTNWIYKGTGGNATAMRYDMEAGQHRWFTAPSGTAGNAISFTQAMTLDASGNLLVGTTSSLGKFTVAGVSGGGNSSAAFSRGTQALDIMAGYALTNGTQAGVDEPLTMTLRSSGSSTGNLALATGNTEHARINAAGNFGIGTTSPTTKLDVNGTVTATTFAGAGTSLTGTATSLSIGGNAATATTAAGLSATLAVASGGTGASTASAARTNLGATTVGGNMFTLTNPSAVTFPRFNADNTVSALDAATFRTAIGAGSSSTTGTVTSVAATVPAFLSVAGSPITSFGTLAISLSGTALPVANGGTGVTTSTGTGSVVLSNSPTLVTPALGTPSSGTLTNCTFPTLNQNTTGTAAGLSVTLAVASGGTGVTTSTGSGNNVLSTSPSLTTPTLTGFTETVFAITDSGSVDINPANGTIQTWTLGANRTPTATSFGNGQSITLMIADGTAYTVTWTTIGVVWVGGSAPSLPTSGYGVIVLWKIAGTVYGNYVGAVA